MMFGNDGYENDDGLLESDHFWLGKLLEHPEMMTQGESLEELEENIKDAYLLVAMD